MDVFYGSVITIDDLLSSIFGNTPDEDYDNQLKFMEKIAKKIGSTTNKAVAVTPSDYQPYVPDGDDVEFEGKRIVRVGKVYHKGYSADIF